ncbi:hypothetical protein T069G_08013 [Trichoderma breve]|uniref:Uncharacterized protein n=1 Tax=Trichoderma breve TaxID=2034170 RepID=A0A9W9BC35_9HYPO|nr:hypothetical protein T069G_08013 [Trichoderma breve]KAJ4857116.1 hypothetical protein T069G_08013 [Trichoderma breve]
MESSNPYSFHLFGDLWLEDPVLYLNENDLAKLEHVMPYLHQLETEFKARLAKASRDNDGNEGFRDRFDLMVKAETTAWKHYGTVQETTFLIPPSGSLNSPVACHLHCPSFTVIDPYSQETADESNVCIKQLIDIGFSPDRCVLYDHLSRREALDGFQFYPADILRIHESFTLELRSRMSAIVDICWGACGAFKGVEIWLEWEQTNHSDDGIWKVIRFVTFVNHPQRMLLAGMSIDEQFYTKTHKPGTYGRLTTWQYKRQQSMNASAIAEISSCTPFVLNTNMPNIETSLPASFTEFRQTLGVPRDHNMDDFFQNIKREPLALFPELGKPTDHKGLYYLASALVSNGADLGQALLICGLSYSNIAHCEEFLDWNDIPVQLRVWIENQRGLKINMKAVESIDDLQRVHRLLCRTQPKVTLQSHGAIGVALDISIRYFKQIEHIGQDASKIADLVFENPSLCEAMPRKCGLCNQSILDDAFPRFKRLDPQRYVLRFLQNGCGLPGCPGNQLSAWAIPADPSVKYTRPDRNKLVALPRKSNWEAYFLRNGVENGSLPENVTLVCRRCRTQLFDDTEPRWTRESTPRYVLRRPNCKTCNKKNTNWSPQNTSILWVDSSKLSRKWASLLKQPAFDPEDVLKNPDWYFPTAEAQKADHQ